MSQEANHRQRHHDGGWLCRVPLISASPSMADERANDTNRQLAQEAQRAMQSSGE